METTKRAVYYYTSWSIYARKYFVKDIPIDYITDLVYAFYNIVKKDEDIWVIESGDKWADLEKVFVEGESVKPADTWNDGLPYHGNFGQFKKLKNLGKNFNLILGIGGWTWSTNFSDAVLTDKSRENFAKSIYDFLETYGIFNGISIDWEYLSDDGVNYGNQGNISRKEDGENFIKFLNVLSQKFNKKYTIDMCVTADKAKAKLPIEKIIPFISQLHVMTYDFHSGAWGESISAHNSNLNYCNFAKYSIKEAVRYYLSRNVPSEKIFIGGVFYSRGFGNSDGLGKPASGNSTDTSWEAGICDYKVLPKNGAKEYFDIQSIAAYSYDPITRNFNSYDNTQSMAQKCIYIKNQKLGGIIIWELSGDAAITNPRSLVKCIYNWLLKP